MIYQLYRLVMYWFSSLIGRAAVRSFLLFTVVVMAAVSAKFKTVPSVATTFFSGDYKQTG